MQHLNWVQQLIVLVPPLLLAITLHEVAHGWAALRFGDTTAQAQGRLSLNPFRHIDPVGTVLVPALVYIFSGFVFGWAKPVPVNFNRLRRPKRDMALVALAGPGSNLVMALGWGLVMVLGRVLHPAWPGLGEPLQLMGQAGIFVNVIIGVLNMLPLPPLDGSRVAVGLLPDGAGRLLARIEPFGLVILLLLLVTGLLQAILWPPVDFLLKLLFSLFAT